MEETNCVLMMAPQGPWSSRKTGSQVSLEKPLQLLDLERVAQEREREKEKSKQLRGSWSTGWIKEHCLLRLSVFLSPWLLILAVISRDVITTYQIPRETVNSGKSRIHLKTDSWLLWNRHSLQQTPQCTRWLEGETFQIICLWLLRTRSVGYYAA